MRDNNSPPITPVLDSTNQEDSLLSEGVKVRSYVPSDTTPREANRTRYTSFSYGGGESSRSAQKAAAPVAVPLISKRNQKGYKDQFHPTSSLGEEQQAQDIASNTANHFTESTKRELSLHEQARKYYKSQSKEAFKEIEKWQGNARVIFGRYFVRVLDKIATLVQVEANIVKKLKPFHTEKVIVEQVNALFKKEDWLKLTQAIKCLRNVLLDYQSSVSIKEKVHSISQTQMDDHATLVQLVLDNLEQDNQEKLAQDISAVLVEKKISNNQDNHKLTQRILEVVELVRGQARRQSQEELNKMIESSLNEVCRDAFYSKVVNIFETANYREKFSTKSIPDAWQVLEKFQRREDEQGLVSEKFACAYGEIGSLLDWFDGICEANSLLDNTNFYQEIFKPLEEMEEAIKVIRKKKEQKRTRQQKTSATIKNGAHLTPSSSNNTVQSSISEKKVPAYSNVSEPNSGVLYGAQLTPPASPERSHEAPRVLGDTDTIKPKELRRARSLNDGRQFHQFFKADERSSSPPLNDDSVRFKINECFLKIRETLNSMNAGLVDQLNSLKARLVNEHPAETLKILQKCFNTLSKTGLFRVDRQTLTENSIRDLDSELDSVAPSPREKRRRIRRPELRNSSLNTSDARTPLREYEGKITSQPEEVEQAYESEKEYLVPGSMHTHATSGDAFRANTDEKETRGREKHHSQTAKPMRSLSEGSEWNEEDNHIQIHRVYERTWWGELIKKAGINDRKHRWGLRLLEEARDGTSKGAADYKYAPNSWHVISSQRREYKA